MFRKSIALILAVCFSLLCLTGCSNSTPSSSVSDAASIANTTDSSADNSSEFDYPSYVNPTGLPITDEPVTLRIMVNNSAEQPDFGAVSCFQEMERRTGVKIIWENIPAGTAAEKVNMAFASGDLPDVFLKCGNVLNNTTLQRFAQEGQIYNLNQGDNLKRYSPNFYEFYQSSETVQAALTFEDGGVYSFPQGVEFSGNKVAGKMFVNTEWLERVGKEMPTTTEELYDVLVAFRDQDANGNGDPNDEIPFVPANFEYCQYGLAGAFGFSNRGLHDLRVDMDEATGKIRMTNASDNYKNFLEYCQKLYDEGLLDNEIFTQQLANVTAKASEDRIGVYISTNLAAIPTNMWDTGNPLRHRDFIRSLQSEDIGACLDVGHLNMVGGVPDETIELLGDRLFALHLHDNMGEKDQHTIPFLGNIKWETIVPALERINYKGEFTYETQIRFAPPSCRDTALRLLYEMGLYITGAEEENGQCAN